MKAPIAAFSCPPIRGRSTRDRPLIDALSGYEARAQRIGSYRARLVHRGKYLVFALELETGGVTGLTRQTTRLHRVALTNPPRPSSATIMSSSADRMTPGGRSNPDSA